MHRTRSVVSAIGVAAVLVATVSCGGVQLGSRATPTPRSTQTATPRTAPGQSIDVADFYRRLGMLAQSVPLPFTGSVSYLAATREDSTNAVISLSLAAGALKFNREGDGYRADYRVSIAVTKDGASVSRLDAAEPVRVATLRETRRTDESVLFQQIVTLPPGQYSMSVSVRDEASGLSSNQELPIRVPRFGEGTFTAPLAYYDVVPRASRDSLPRVVANPRGAATVGVDSTISLYVEGYGASVSQQLMLAVRVDDQTVWSDSIRLASGQGLSSGVARVPVSRIGIGAVVAQVWHSGANDTLRTPLFVGIGDELPITTYADMLGYLRFFTTPERLSQLENVSPPLRSEAWSAFNRETDVNPSTPENEALTDYLARLRRANERFVGEGPAGWRTDRGMVLLILGEPDQVIDQGSNDLSQRGRSQTWEYRTLGYSVDFVFAGASNQWRLFSATEAQLRAVARRRVGP